MVSSWFVSGNERLLTIGPLVVEIQFSATYYDFIMISANFKSYNTTTGDLNWSIIYQFTKLRGFQTKSSIIAEEVYLKIWRLLTQILTRHMPSVGTRGGCFPWPMIALVRYCWLGRDIVNSTTRDDNQQWPKMTIIKAELTRAQRTRMRHFGGGQCQSRPALKMEQKHIVTIVTIVTSHTGLSGKGQCQLALCQPLF